MHPPHGPHRIARNGQLVLPRDVLREAGLEAGQSVYLVANDEPAGTVLVIPAELAARWFESGRMEHTAEALREQD